MKKTNVMLTISGEILEIFDNAVGKGNRSKAIEDYMQTYSLTKNDKIEGINAEILRKEIEKLTKTIAELTAEQQKKQKLLDSYYQKRDEEQQKQLIEEKNRMEKAKECVKCGKNTEGLPVKSFPLGTVCRSCFLSAGGEDLKKWTKAE